MDNNNFDNNDNMNVIDFNNYQNQNNINPNMNNYQTSINNNQYMNDYQNQDMNNYQTTNIDMNQNQQPVQDMNQSDIVNEMSSLQADNIFGSPINNEQENTISDDKIEVNLDEKIEEEKPKYGYISNEKPNLDKDDNANIKFIIFLAILMIIVIILLPFLSNLI